MDLGFNFRSSAAHIADGANQTYVVLATSFPTTRTVEGVSRTFGWVGSPSVANKTHGHADPRFAGMHRKTNTGGTIDFIVELGPGTYDLSAVLGDIGNDLLPVTYYDWRYEFFDDLDGTGGTLTQVHLNEDLGGTARKFIRDTEGNQFSTIEEWIAGHAKTRVTLAGTHLRVRFGTLTAEVGSSAIQHLRIESVAAGPATKLGVATQPLTSEVDELIYAAVEARRDDDTMDVAATGDVTVELLSWPAGENEPVLHGTLVAPLSGGSAIFPDLSLALPGTGYALRFTHATLTQVDSDSFDITVPEGGGGTTTTIILPTRREMQPMNAGASTKGRTLVFDLLDVDGVPVLGASGKAQLSVNGAAAVASVNDIAAHPIPGRYTVVLDATELAAEGDYVAVVPFGAAETVLGGEAIVVAYDPNAAVPAVADIAAGVLANPTNKLQTDEAGFVTSTNAGAGLTGEQADQLTDLHNRVTDARAAGLDLLSDIDVAAGDAATAAALVEARLTPTRAGLLDNLDAAISSISAGGGGLTTEQATQLADLHTRLTAIRAALLDNLDVPVSEAGSPSATATAVRGELAPELAVVNALGDTLEDDGGVYRFTEDALAMAPAGGGGGGGLTPEQEAKLDAILREAAQAFVLGDRVGSTVTMTILDSEGATIGTRTLTFKSPGSTVLESVGPLVEA